MGVIATKHHIRTANPTVAMIQRVKMGVLNRASENNKPFYYWREWTHIEMRVFA